MNNIAGSPTAPDDFLAGFRTAAVITAALFIAAAVAAFAADPARSRPG